MSRAVVTLRQADPDDAEFLATLWRSSLRCADESAQLADVQQLVKDAAASPEQRLVVAEHDGVRAGAVLLQIGCASPLDPEPVVRVLALRVDADFQRRGIGRRLMESSVAFGEDNGVVAVLTAVDPGSRDANRFLARLALTPLAGYRSAPITAVRARMNAQHPSMAASPARGRQRTRVLAARRHLKGRRSPSG